MNIFEYAFAMEANFKKNINELSGYEAFTTFYSDLTIGEIMEGTKGVNDTHKNVMESWINDIKYITEYCICLNHKSWEMDARLKQGQTKLNNQYDVEELGKLYSNLFYQCKDAIYKHYEKNQSALNYFFNTTD